MPYHMIIDTETTGLPNSQFAVPIQVAIVVIDGEGNLVHTDCWYVMPKTIDTAEFARAKAVHGISLATLEEHAITMAASVEKLKQKWLSYGRPLLYAYNVSFDELMIARMGWAPGGYWGPCIMQAAGAFLSKPKKVKLVEACQLLLVEGPGNAAHDALADALAAMRVGLKVGVFV